MIIDYKIGDKVVCVTDRLKSFSRGKVYIVEDIIFVNDIFRRRVANKFKLQNIKGYVSCRNFTPLGKDDLRDILVSDILGEKTSIIAVGPTTNRKIDEVEDKEYQLFELLMNRFARDRNIIKYISDYTDFGSMVSSIVKGDRIWGIEDKDFDCIRNMSIEELLTNFIKHRQSKK
jgi:hypothetical protein